MQELKVNTVLVLSLKVPQNVVHASTYGELKVENFNHYCLALNRWQVDDALSPDRLTLPC